MSNCHQQILYVFPITKPTDSFPCVQSCLPTTCSVIFALSSTFSICTWRSYFPECALSVLRMKRMVSTSLFLTLANVGLRGSPSLLQMTFGLGLPCKTRRTVLMSSFGYLKSTIPNTIRYLLGITFTNKAKLKKHIKTLFVHPHHLSYYMHIHHLE